jgi:predicted nucleotidyltransferase
MLQWFRSKTGQSMGKSTIQSPGQQWYRGKDVPKRVIERFAQDVARRFSPEKIILFGSHATGHAHADSDVDILVVMPARNQLDQAAKIHLATTPPFPLHLLVRTPTNLAWRLAEGDSFLREVMETGKLLYEKADARVGGKGRRRLRGSTRTAKH